MLLYFSLIRCMVVVFRMCLDAYFQVRALSHSDFPGPVGHLLLLRLFRSATVSNSTTLGIIAAFFIKVV